MAKDNKEQKKKRPTALKRGIQDEKKRILNKNFKSKVRTAVRRFNESVEKKESTESTLSEAISLVDKAVKRGIYKRNKGNRVKSRLTSRLAVTA